MSKSLIPLAQKDIESKILNIRNTQVILDKDLAAFYGVKPIRLREQVKRNANRFPEDFVFQLSENEVDMLVSQNAIPSLQFLGGHLPFVFTEQGVAAVSAILKTEKAAEISVLLMRAFVAMRRFLLQNSLFFERLDRIELKQLEADYKFDQLFKALENRTSLPEKGIFFNGQVYDAWQWVSQLVQAAQKSLVLLDNYVDDVTLSLMAKKAKGVEVEIYTKTISRSLQVDAEKFNQQYGGLTFHPFDKSHDRFLVIDQTEVYHIGASLKDLGKKWFAFSKMDSNMLNIFEKLAG